MQTSRDTYKDSVPSFSLVYPPWGDICDCYGELNQKIKMKIKDQKNLALNAESLFWEQYAFEIILTMLYYNKISFEAYKSDIRVIEKDSNGVRVEIDFRAKIRDRMVYFGVTHFYGRPKDLKKDVKRTNVEVGNFRGDNILSPSRRKITGIRSQSEYLNRRMVNRVSKEGRHKFNNDYIYVFFPKLDIGFGGGLDAIPPNFSFQSKYEYRPFGITGIILIGQFIEVGFKNASICEDKLLVKTLSFNNSSSMMTDILSQLDDTILDERNRIEQVKSLLRQKNQI